MNLKLPQPEFREGGPSKNGNMKKELPAVRKCLQQVDPTSIRRLLPIFFIYPFICNFYSYLYWQYIIISILNHAKLTLFYAD